MGLHCVTASHNDHQREAHGRITNVANAFVRADKHTAFKAQANGKLFSTRAQHPSALAGELIKTAQRRGFKSRIFYSFPLFVFFAGCVAKASQRQSCTASFFPISPGLKNVILGDILFVAHPVMVWGLPRCFANDKKKKRNPMGVFWAGTLLWISQWMWHIFFSLHSRACKKNANYACEKWVGKNRRFFIRLLNEDWDHVLVYNIQ